MVRKSYNNKRENLLRSCFARIKERKKFGKIKCTSPLLKKIEYEVAASLSVS